MRSPLLHPRILLLPPVFLDSLLGQDLSAPPTPSHHIQPTLP
jgi:hypothetical protein